MAISIFMEVESEVDGVIKGGCDVKGREGWMECLEMNHSVNQPIDKTTGAKTGIRVHDPIRVTKMTDVATPLLYKQICTGAVLTNVKFHYYEIKGGKEKEYFTIELRNATLVSISPTMFNTRMPEWERMPHLETLEFGYEEIVWTENVDNHTHMDNFRNDS